MGSGESCEVKGMMSIERSVSDMEWKMLNMCSREKYSGR